MRQKFIIANLFLISTLVLSGCASTWQWQNVAKSKNTRLQYDRDAFECDKQSKIYVSRREYGSAAAMEEYDFTIRCMNAAGWRKVPRKNRN